MKALVCEMCGGTNLLKQEGVFVCQNCKTRYSVEEAKRMMIEGTVDVTGSTVKVDKYDKLVNLYKVARRAREDGNTAQAFKYYEQLQMEDPDNWESTFFIAYPFSDHIFQLFMCQLIKSSILPKFKRLFFHV
jgi:DNA-directed RNA polymerase subunit M/transcription elongation factor TFIIS